MKDSKDLDDETCHDDDRAKGKTEKSETVLLLV